MGRNASFPPIWYVVYRAVLTLNNTSGKQWVPILLLSVMTARYSWICFVNVNVESFPYFDFQDINWKVCGPRFEKNYRKPLGKGASSLHQLFGLWYEFL